MFVTHWFFSKNRRFIGKNFHVEGSKSGTKQLLSMQPCSIKAAWKSKFSGPTNWHEMREITLVQNLFL
jgi:hypothetical protein